MSIKRWICIVICLMLLSTCVFPQNANARAMHEELASILNETCTRLLETSTMEPGDSTSDWIALVSARNGYSEDRDAYLQGLWEYVSDQYQKHGGLDTIKATVWHRISLTVLALGADPTCFGEDADGNLINLIADGTYNWKMTDSLGIQGTNAWIYALMVLDSMNYEIPQDALYTREKMIEEILNYQVEDGGFHIGSGVSDADVTAMALQALAPYYPSNEMVAQSVDQALGYLSGLQNAQGDFGNGGSESCAQIILALCALGIDPETDERFCKAGGSVLNGLLLYHVGDGGFSHLLGEDANSLSTQQAAQALTALKLLRSGEGRLYDFSDNTIEPYAPQAGISIWISVGAALVILTIIIVCILKGKKKCTV